VSFRSFLRPAYARSASYGGFESAEARKRVSAKMESGDLALDSRLGGNER